LIIILIIIKYGSNELKNNYNIVFEAIKNSCWGLRYASDELKNNKLFLISCYKINNNIVKYNYNFIFDTIINLKYPTNELENNCFEYNYDFIKKFHNIEKIYLMINLLKKI